MGNEYYDKDGYVFTKTRGGFEPKWDGWSQSQVREGADLNSSSSGYTPDGRPLYTKRESVSSDSGDSSSDDGALAFLVTIIFLFLIIIAVVATVLLLYFILAPTIAVIRKESKTNEGKEQLRNFAVTMVVTISLIIMSVTTSRALLGFYSNDWIRLIQFILTTTLWGITLHYAIRREYWRPALVSCEFFGRSYVEESKIAYRNLQHLIERYA